MTIYKVSEQNQSIANTQPRHTNNFFWGSLIHFMYLWFSESWDAKTLQFDMKTIFKMKTFELKMKSKSYVNFAYLVMTECPQKRLPLTLFIGFPLNLLHENRLPILISIKELEPPLKAFTWRLRQKMCFFFLKMNLYLYFFSSLLLTTAFSLSLTCICN